MKLYANPAIIAACAYVERNRRCREQPVGELRGHYYKDQNGGSGWPMCARHIKPEMHPTGLRDKLFSWDGA